MIQSAIFFKVIFVLLLYLIHQSKSECPYQKTFNFTKIKVCVGVKCITQEIDRCIDPEGVTNNEITNVEIIGKVPIFRRGAIQNLPELKRITGVSINVTKLNVGCFLNLPKLISVNFLLNNMEEILWGVFNNSTIETIDLSWGLISSIESEAFSNMPNLRIVFLTGNKLETFDKSWFTNTNNLKKIFLGYNKITKIRTGSFDMFPGLDNLDLSFNQIKDLESGMMHNINYLEILDLTGNELPWIRPDIALNTTIRQLFAPLNKISLLPIKLLQSTHVQHIVLHPNPWQCACLDEITKWAHENENSVKILPPDDDIRINYDVQDASKPECYVSNTKNCDVTDVRYDSDFLKGQEQFFKEVHYSSFIMKNLPVRTPGSESIFVDTSAYVNFSRF